MDGVLDNLAKGWRGYVVVALIALLTGLPGLARLPVIDRDEARFAQATTQMLETGDYVRIYVQHTPRNKKPIGIYWLQAASVSAFSHVEARAIWAYRLPSVLGAMLAACAAFWAGTAFFPRRAALIGAGLFGAGMLIGFEAMTAKTDAVLCGVTTLAMAALAHLYAAKNETHARVLALTFWAAMGVGVLVKGPVSPMVATLTLLALFAWERRAAWMRILLWWPGPALAALVVLPWMIAIAIATHGAFFVDAVGEDMAPKLVGGSEGHAQPPGAYTLLLSLLIFPATFLLPAAARLGWRALRAPRGDPESAGVRFLLAWAVPTFLAFELFPTKLPHYTLPTYPAIALIAAAAFTAARAEKWRLTQTIGYALFGLAAFVLVVVTAYATTFMPGDVSADTRRVTQTLLTGLALAAPAFVALVWIRADAIKLAIAIAFSLTASYAIRERVLPEARSLLVSHAVATTLERADWHPRLSRNAPPLWVVGYGEPSLVFETATNIRIAGPSDAAPAAAPGDIMVVEQRAYDELAAALLRRGLMLDARQSVAGHDYANGDDVVLLIGRVTGA